MVKKRAGRLSGSMIVRNRKRAGVGFVIGESRAPDPHETDKPRPAQAEAGSAAPPSTRGGDPEKVVTLFPRSLEATGADFTASDGRPAPTTQNADRLVEALRSADIAEAEDIFSALTGLDHVEVLRLLYGPDGRDLALACRAVGMEQLQFVSVYILSRKLGLGEESLDPRELTRIVAFFEAIDEAEAVVELAAMRAGAEGAGEPVTPA